STAWCTCSGWRWAVSCSRSDLLKIWDARTLIGRFSVKVKNLGRDPVARRKKDKILAFLLTDVGTTGPAAVSLISLFGDGYRALPVAFRARRSSGVSTSLSALITER